MKEYIGAIDQGTTSTRFILFDANGQIAAIDQMEHRQYRPQPGWVEHDPQEILRNTQTVIGRAIEQLPGGTGKLVAIGITNQRETILAWNKRTGAPYHPAIVWQDTRSDRICARLIENGGLDRYRPTTGLPINTYFSGPKMVWMLENIPGLRQAAEDGEALFGTIDSWLVWILTGGIRGGKHVTDVTNASRTLLMDLTRLAWSQPILDELGIPSACLPTIQPSLSSFGSTEIGDETVPIFGVLGDQQASLFGQTCFSPGELKNTYGTGCFILMNTGATPIASTSGLLTTLAYQESGQKPVYALEGSVAVAGSLVQWLRDNIGLIQTSAEIETLARSVKDNGGMYIVPAFSGLFAPYWRSDARGVMVGLTGYIAKGHIARAALEATAYQTLDVIEAMRKDAGVPLSLLKVDGGMVNNDLLMQFQTDILGIPVVRPQVSESTALGAAFAAGLTAGFWTGMDDLRSKWSEQQRWTSRISSQERTTLYKGWQKAVIRAFDWIES